jgi:F0F1-type ATP synthase assembly protein I
MKGANMVEDDTPNRKGEEEDTPLVIPTHAPLPPLPEIQFTRPTLNRRRPAKQGTLPLGEADTGSEASSGHGAGLAAGFTFVASVLAGLIAGTWLDAHYNHSSTPWGTIVMTLAGMGVGFTNLSKLLSRGKRRKP